MGWIMLAHHNDFDFRQLLSQAPGDIQASDARHADIEENDVRLQFLRSFKRFRAVRGFAADFPRRLGGQDPDNAAPNDLAIVSNQNTQKINLQCPLVCDPSSDGPVLLKCIFLLSNHSGQDWQYHRDSRSRAV
jgi:hypothetical protein